MTAHPGNEALSLRWTGIASLFIWLTCLLLLLPSPWHWADQAARTVEHVSSIEQKHAATEGTAEPQGPRQIDVDNARRMAWIEWLWIATTVMVGLVVAAFANKKRVVWAGGTLLAVGLYLLNRWSFGPSSYRELFRALFDTEARAGQSFLMETAPLAFAQLTYFNLVVPAALVLVVIVGLMARKSR